MNGEVVRKSLDIDLDCDLPISVVKDNSRHQDSKEVLRTDKGVPAFRTLFKGMVNNSHSDHFLVEFKCLGRMRYDRETVNEEKIKGVRSSEIYHNVRWQIRSVPQTA